MGEKVDVARAMDGIAALCRDRGVAAIPGVPEDHREPLAHAAEEQARLIRRRGAGRK